LANIRIHEGRIYCGSYDNNVYCVDANNGTLVWKFKTNGFVHGMPAVGEDLVVFGSWDCNLYAVTKDTGKLVWKFPTSLSAPSPIGSPEEKQAKTAEVVWTPISKGEEKKYKHGEVDIADYGNFSGNYINVGKSDYMAERKKGYLK
jgi:outer membrane protein assembly factor BamB